MKSKLTVNKIKKIIKTGNSQTLTIASNLIMEVLEPGVATFHFRYQLEGNRKIKKIGTYGENNSALMSVEAAFEKVMDLKRLLNLGADPIVNSSNSNINNIDDLFMHFFSHTTCEYTAEKRIYNNDLKPFLGDKNLELITGFELKISLKKIVVSGRLSIARRALYLIRTVFTDAFENRILDQNIANNLDIKRHAGGPVPLSGVALAEFEIERFFALIKDYPEVFTETTVIALALLLIFGQRKMELLTAEWEDLDWEQNILSIWSNSSKNNLAIAIPVPDSVIPLFQRLKVLSNGSNFMFPARRKSNTPHISADTINTAINKLFGKSKMKGVLTENVLKKAGVPYFVLHDLRRTFRSLLPGLDVREDVAESCLNHRPKGLIKVYNRFNYIELRKVAHDKVAKIILPMAGFEYINKTEFPISRTLQSNSEFHINQFNNYNVQKWTIDKVA
ncbi:MAG: site-specific integrase [Alteromonadaceae bacterium]